MSERRGWWRFTLDVLRPVRKPTRLSRRSLLADLLLAIVLTIAAVAATAGATDGTHRVDGQPHSLSEPLQLRPSPPPRGGDVPPDRWERPAIPPDGQEDSGPLPLLVVLTALPLAVRRLYPLIAFWAVLAAALATHDGATWITVLTFAIAGYGAVAHSPHRAPAMGGLVLAAVLAGAAFRDSVPALPSWLGPFVVLMSAGVAAGFVRSWRRQLDAGRRRFTELQRAQEEAMRKAVQEERSRIAGELHDVVTHNVNVMVIQAGAARAVMDTAPARSRQAMLAVEAGGRAAMAELRHVMGLLAGPESERADGSAGGLEPQPGLDQLDSLIERVRAAGVPVSVEISPPPRPLPPGVELAVYRVIQEALTNTIKHAAGAAASVTIDYHGDWLEIEITDTGGRRTTGAGDGQGRGLIGMRERLALYGGTLQAGTRSGGGYQIKARILWATT
ncbi:histidine kinase [Microbispora sp. NPDC046973]|uniref:sensor histidine kinase n=1 Tax=Microbispora sp. NPDC046973 TaxID=3155022 RepID=UPI00340E6D24